MSGHSKWSKIKRKKGANDAKRSKIWARITREIMITARDGGGDLGTNSRLGLAVDKGKSANMPKDNIERAIKRGTGEIEGADYEEITYEGYGPYGVAVFVEVLTDNTNRSVADIRSIFSKSGGNLGTTGSVGYLFDRKGILEMLAEGLDEDELFMLVADAGADDLEHDDDTFTITTSIENFGAVQVALTEAGLTPSDAELQRIPTTAVTLPPEGAAKIIKMIERLEDHQDVQAVFTTLEFDEATLAAIS